MAEKQPDKRQQRAESLRKTLEENVARAEADLKKLIEQKGTGHSREPQVSKSESLKNSFSQKTFGKMHGKLVNRIAQGKGSLAQQAEKAITNRRESIAMEHMAANGQKERGHVDYIFEDIADAIKDVKQNYDNECTKRTGLKFEDTAELNDIITHNTEVIAHDAEKDNQPIYNPDLYQDAFNTEELIKTAQQSIKEKTGIDFSEGELSDVVTTTNTLTKEAREVHAAHYSTIKLEEHKTGDATKRMLERHPEKEGAEILAMTAYLDQQGRAPDNVTAIDPLNNPNIDALKEEQKAVLDKMQALREEMRTHQKEQSDLIENTFEDTEKVHESLNARDKEAFAMSLESMPENKGLGKSLVDMSTRKMMENKIPELVLAAEPETYGKRKEGLDTDSLEENAAIIADKNLHIKAIEADLAYLEEKFEKYNCHIEPYNSPEQQAATARHIATQITAKKTAFKDDDQQSQKVTDRYNSFTASKSQYHNAHVIERIKDQIEEEKAQGEKANTYVDTELVNKLEDDLQVEKLRDALHDAHVNEKERAAFKAEKNKEDAARRFEAFAENADTLQIEGMEQITLEGDKVTTIEADPEVALQNESTIAEHVKSQQERALAAGAAQGKSPKESVEFGPHASEKDLDTKIEAMLEEGRKEPDLGDVNNIDADIEKDNDPTIGSR